MKIASSALITAVAAIALVVANASGGPGARAPLGAQLMDVSSAGVPQPAPAAVPEQSDGRAAYLQELVAQARQQNEQLGEIDDELATLRQQAADREAEKEAEAEEVSVEQTATLQALDTLRRAEAKLAFGNSDGVDDQLANASAALWGQTLVDVEAAREALSNEDLFLARQYLAAALAERR